MIPIPSPWQPSSNIPDAIPSPNLGPPYNIWRPLVGCVCIGAGPAFSFSSFASWSIFGVCKTRPPFSGTGCECQDGSHSSTLKLTNTLSVTPLATSWTLGEPTLWRASAPRSPGTVPYCQAAPANSNALSEISCAMSNSQRLYGMGGRNLERPYSSCWEVPWALYNVGEAGTRLSSPDAILMAPLRGAYPTTYNCPSPSQLSTAQCAIWNGASSPYTLCGPKIPSSAAPVRAPFQLERACAIAIPPPSWACDSALSRCLCESTETDRSDTTSQCSDMSTVVPSQSSNPPASGVPAAPHDHHTVPTTAQTMAASPTTCDFQRAPVGIEPSAGSSSS